MWHCWRYSDFLRISHSEKINVSAVKRMIIRHDLTLLCNVTGYGHHGFTHRHFVAMVLLGHIADVERSQWLSFAVFPVAGSPRFPSPQVHRMLRFPRHLGLPPRNWQDVSFISGLQASHCVAGLGSAKGSVSGWAKTESWSITPCKTFGEYKS